jgi:glycosyltransferase involved in cell wall biosynthesis
MAAGCAILADDDVPRQEILDSGHCGRLVQSRNSSLIALELKKMIEDRSAMLDIALKSWRRAKEKYSPEVVSKQYAQAFTELIKSN